MLPAVLTGSNLFARLGPADGEFSPGQGNTWGCAHSGDDAGEELSASSRDS